MAEVKGMGNHPEDCPVCGNELGEGDLYCSQCGTELQQAAAEAKKQRRRKRWQVASRFLTSLILMIMAGIIGVAVGSLDLLGLSEPEKTPLVRARDHAAAGEYMKAEQAYKALINGDLTNEDLYRELLNFYLKNERKDKANNLLRWANGNGVYGLDGLRPAPPACDLPSGSYEEKKTVTVTSGEGGNIYYTTDSSVPTTKSTRYSGPIKLEEGKITLLLMSESPIGILSELAEYHYEILPPKMSVNQTLTSYIGKSKGELESLLGPVKEQYSWGNYFYLHENSTVAIGYNWKRILGGSWKGMPDDTKCIALVAGARDCIQNMQESVGAAELQALFRLDRAPSITPDRDGYTYEFRYDGLYYVCRCDANGRIKGSDKIAVYHKAP